jgi:hypothetical protein
MGLAIFVLILLTLAYVLGYHVGREDIDQMSGEDLSERFDSLRECQRQREELEKKLKEISELEA